MPNGLWYANQPYDTGKGVAASAFSKGDLLMFDSTSSLSRIDPSALSTDGIIAGIALADSDKALRGASNSEASQAAYLIPGDDDNLWASLATNVSSVTPGVRADILFSLANHRYYVDPASQNSVSVVIVRGTDGPLAVDQSDQSRVLVRLLANRMEF